MLALNTIKNLLSRAYWLANKCLYFLKNFDRDPTLSRVRMAEVDNLSLIVRPVSGSNIFFVWRFTCCLVLVRFFAWETLFPTNLLFPVKSHVRAITIVLLFCHIYQISPVI